MIDIKLDNIQLTLPDDQDRFLDAFVTEEKESPSLSKPTSTGARIFESREMKQDELGYPILCDLGAAVLVEEQSSGVVQALPYRAPEVILGAEWDQKIDIWNVGVLVGLKAQQDESNMLTCLRFGNFYSTSSFLERAVNGTV